MIFLSGFDDGIYNGTDLGTVRRVAEQPVFPADDERFDTPLRLLLKHQSKGPYSEEKTILNISRKRIKPRE